MKYSQRITVHRKIICHSVEYLTEINEQNTINRIINGRRCIEQTELTRKHKAHDKENFGTETMTYFQNTSYDATIRVLVHVTIVKMQNDTS
jgi:phage replication-related protein YjqB (UPF0714/DUF867 family)